MSLFQQQGQQQKVTGTKCPDRPDATYPRRPDGGVRGGEVGSIIGNADLMKFMAIHPDGKNGYNLVITIPIQSGADGTNGALHLTGDSEQTREGNAGTMYSLWAKGSVTLGDFPDPVTGETGELTVSVNVQGARFLPTDKHLAPFKTGPVKTAKAPAASFAAAVQGAPKASGKR